MDFHRNPSVNNRHSPSPASSVSSTTVPHNPSATTATADNDPMHSWWESVSKARSRIHALSSILPPHSDSFFLSSLADSDRPALSLLSSHDAYSVISSALSSSVSGSGSDPLCHWLYDTFLSSDPHLRLVVLSFLPLLSSLYLSRVHSTSSDSPSPPSLAGFEAVLLALYSSEVKSRAGKPVLVAIPDLSQPSLYHSPLNKPNSVAQAQFRPSVGVLCPSLEPQNAVKSTKRACIIGVALDCYYKQISQMPSWSKLELCRSAASWAGQDCCCKREFDKEDVETCGNNSDDSEPKGFRIPLPWELLQPLLRILGHCLLAPLNSQDVKDAASVAVRCLYARASHDLVPQVILATRSLIQLDNRTRAAAKAATATNAYTPSKDKKSEILLLVCMVKAKFQN
ncbi:hypothetical protein SDJN02_04924, partial [Cucurbita argyrosperma subsp. argyrosperma]